MPKRFFFVVLLTGLLLPLAPAQAQYAGGLPYSAGTFYPLGGLLGTPFTSYAKYGMAGMGAASTGMWYGSQLGMGLLRSALFFGTTHLNGNHTSVNADDYQSKSSNQPSVNNAYQEVHADWLPAAAPEPETTQPEAYAGPYLNRPEQSANARVSGLEPGASASLPEPSPAPLASNMVAPISLHPVISEDKQIANNSPIAAGFVDLVENKFNGHISSALADPEVRSWGRALGLNTAHLSSSREKVIEGVLKDDDLDPVTKVEAVKALMHS